MMKPMMLLFVTVVMSRIASAQELMIKSDDKSFYVEHTVAAKEGLYAIGRLYNVNPKTIAAFNKVDLNAGLNIGQPLRIPLSDTNFTQKKTTAVPLYYLPGSGEGLMKVSNLHRKVALANLRSWNKLNGDNIKAGDKLIVGWLVSKDYKKPEPVLSQPEPSSTIQQPAPAAVQSEPVARNDSKTAERSTENDGLQSKPAERSTENDGLQSKPGERSIENDGLQIKPLSEDGFFKTYFEQQIKVAPVSKNTTVTAGIFKTSSGWQDAKYYLLMDGVATGTIVRITNPDNNKAVYAKVLGAMNGIRQNQGLGVRISNAAASMLGIREEEKFIVAVTY